MCGKGVGLGLFPSDSFKSQSCRFDEIAHLKPLYDIEKYCEENRKKSLEMAVFWSFLD